MKRQLYAIKTTDPVTILIANNRGGNQFSVGRSVPFADPHYIP